MQRNRGWIWFFVVLAPTSSVIPVISQTGAEHRMYLPLAGIVSLTIVGASSPVRCADWMKSSTCCCRFVSSVIYYSNE